jgi:hypothetical protein
VVRQLVRSKPGRYPDGMGEHIEHRNTERPRTVRKHPSKQTPETIGRRLLEIVVYDKCCRIGGKLSLDDLAETSEVGEWKMPDFKAARSYAVSQGWLIVEDDVLTLTTAGLRTA